MPQNRSDFDGLPSAGPARPEDVIEDLGDGLLLRRARSEDIEANAAFQSVVQADPPDFEPFEHIAHWVRQLMDGSHPICRARDFLLVHDTRSDQVVSSLGLLSHTLAYDGIPVPTGMPELVGTHPDYRHRRLIARQFAEVHRWSEERGQLLQIIDGIPWYYRQFGYEMAAQNMGGLYQGRSLLPGEPVKGLGVRAAIEADAPFITRCFDHGMKRYRLTCRRDEAFWRFELSGRHGFSTQTRFLKIVETDSGEPRAVFNHVPILLDHGWTRTPMFEAAPGVAWPEVVDAALFFLREVGAELASQSKQEHAGAALVLGTEHPALEVLRGRGGRPRRPYAWYLRVADPVGFLKHVAPALEARLVGSPYQGHDGELALSFFRSGVRLHFEKGQLREIAEWRPSTEEVGDVSLPDLSFLNLLFGHRSLVEIADAFPDCQITRRQALVETLFPKQPSFLMPTS
jgi:hypothetical protein